MDNDEVFYCVGCNALHRKDEAAVCFRTGYFRIQYPLGICSRCSPSLIVREEAASDNDGGKHIPVKMKML